MCSSPQILSMHNSTRYYSCSLTARTLTIFVESFAFTPWSEEDTHPRISTYREQGLVTAIECSANQQTEALDFGVSGYGEAGMSKSTVIYHDLLKRSMLQILPYSVLLEQLQMPTIRELEDLIIDAIYMEVIRGKLDQKGQQFEVEYTIGRDLEPGKIESLLTALQNW